ncbi:hypothetical protein D5289_07150 [Lactiplantibacillus plantarum]|nr:hypothetical protein D5289_07150 [Lactiplantibacillus plantarum]
MKFHHWAFSETPSSRDGIRMADTCVLNIWWTCHFFTNSNLSINCQTESDIVIAHYFGITSHNN